MMNGWGIAVIVLLSIDFAVKAALHGKPRPNYNGLIALADAIITAVLIYKAGCWQVGQ